MSDLVWYALKSTLLPSPPPSCALFIALVTYDSLANELSLVNSLVLVGILGLLVKSL